MTPSARSKPGDMRRLEAVNNVKNNGSARLEACQVDGQSLLAQRRNPSPRRCIETRETCLWPPFLILVVHIFCGPPRHGSLRRPHPSRLRRPPHASSANNILATQGDQCIGPG